MSARAEGGTRRRRRTPEAAQREIIEAAQALLHERPFRELTVDEVMRRTGLSRPSFYVYFKDRHDLVLRIVQSLAAELMIPSLTWLESGGPEVMRESIAGGVEVYRQHAPVFRALADAAADDPEVEEVYGGIVQAFIDAIGAQLEREIATGRVAHLNAEEVAKAVVWMAERYLYLSFAPGHGNDIAPVVDTLYTVYRRTFYGTS